MKRFLSVVLSLLMVISSFALLPFSAFAEQEYDWTFIRNSYNTECIITGNTGNKYKTALLIPKKVAGLTVRDCTMHLNEYPNLKVLALYVDTAMKLTPDCKGCTNLSRIDLVTDDGDTLVSSNVLPDSMTEVTYGAFAGSALKELTLPNVELIGRDYSTGAFENCDSLQTVKINKPARMFANTFSCIDSECRVEYNGPLSEWTYGIVAYSPDLVAECNDGWFGWCGDSWDKTGAQNQRSNLYWKLTDSGELSVESSWTENAESLQTVKTHNWDPDKVTSLKLKDVYDTGKNSFRYTRIKTLELPSGVNTIGDYSFESCSELTEVHIPKSVKTIGNYAFAYCEQLKDIYFDGTYDEWNAISKKNGWKSGAGDFKVHCKVSVNFDANGHGKSPASQTDLVSYTDKVTEPAAPSEHQFEFRGWYTEPECVNKWNFDSTVEGNMTLYAKWERVIFNINVVKTEGGNATSDRSEAYERTLIHLDPKTSDGWVFKDWEIVSGSTTVQNDSFMMPAEDVTIKPVYEKVQNGINVVSTTGGSAYADKNTAAAGETVNIYATPDEGWKFKEWEVVMGGVSVNGIGNETASFTMNSQPSVAVRAVFERITHKLTVHTNNHGYLDTGYETDGIPAGWDVNLIPYADSGYRLKDISFMTEGVSFRYPYVFNMPGFDVDVYAEFEAIPVSAININTTGNGTVSANKNSAESGENVYLTVTPDEGNRLKCINVMSGNTELWLDEGGYGFEMPDTEVSILAEFEEIPPIHTLTGEGVIFFDESINKITEAEEGSNVTVSVDDAQTPDGYYFTKTYLANDVDVVVEDTNDGKFVMPAHDVTVTPVYAEREDGEVDLTGEEAVVLPEKDLAGLLTESEFAYYDDQRNSWYFDFNKDGTPDVWLDCDKNTVQRAEGAASADKNYTIPVDYLIPPRFKSLKFIFAFDPVVETYEVKAIAEEGGTVNGSAVYEKGATAIVTATPAEGYEFEGWYENGEKISSSASFTFEVTGFTRLVAKFAKKIINVKSVVASASSLTLNYKEGKKTVTFTVYSSDSKPFSGKQVKLSFNGKTNTYVTDSNGRVRYAVSDTLEPKTYKITATCDGVSASTKVVVKQSKSKITASAKSYKAAVKTKKYSVVLKNNKGKPINKAKVYLKVNNKTYTAKTDSKGKATFKITKLNKKGKYTAKVIFKGNKYFKKLTKKAKITVK